MKPTWITTVWAVLGKSMGWSSSKNKTIYYSENWVRRIEPTKNITQEIAKKWRNYEEYAVSKRMESDNWELKKENPSAVNQLLSQIQELQDKVNSLNEEKEFCALETAISSGMFHVHNQPSSIPSPRGMIGRDSCLQPDTRNSLGTLEHVFEGPPAAEWPSPSFFKIPKNLTSSPCELRSGETESTMRHGEGLRQGTARVQKYRLLDLPGKTRPGIPCIILEELISKLSDGNAKVHFLGIAFRKIPSLKWLSMLESQFQDRSVCVRVHRFLNSQCRGSIQWRWQNQ